jgi:hypothetical protein
MPLRCLSERVIGPAPACAKSTTTTNTITVYLLRREGGRGITSVPVGRGRTYACKELLNNPLSPSPLESLYPLSGNHKPMKEVLIASIVFIIGLVTGFMLQQPPNQYKVVHDCITKDGTYHWDAIEGHKTEYCTFPLSE